MTYASEEFRRIYLPYCLQRVEDHGHLVLNRVLRPLGMRAGDAFDPGAHAVKFVGLTPARAEQISHNRSSNTDMVYLYDEGSAPTLGAEAWEHYQRRLAVLAAIELR